MNTSQFYTIWAIYLLIFVRMVGFFVQAPIWGSHHIPKPVLVGTCAMFSILLFPIVPVPKGLEALGDKLAHGDFAPLIFFIAMQFTVGLAIGYMSFIIMASVQFGAECLDVQMGLSVAASFDPASHGAVNMIRRWAFYLAMILYLLFNCHYKALEAMRFSYEVIPLDGINISQKLIYDLMLKTGYIFSIGLQIASPVVAALFVTQVALGLLARVAPQMNVFMLSFPLNILIGLTLLGAMLLLLRDRLEVLFGEEVHWMFQTVRVLIPRPAGLILW